MAQLLMHVIHLGVDGQELALQSTAVVNALQSIQGCFQVMLAGN